jgi:hypothetical protein
MQLKLTLIMPPLELVVYLNNLVPIAVCSMDLDRA